MLKIAKKVSLAAAKIILDNFRKIDSHVIREKTKNDFLTFVDEEAEKIIIDTILEVYPDHAILAEESGKHKKDSIYQWIIDPLDGTKNYIAGIPIFGISIALQVKNEIELGVVYDPINEEMFSAEKNKGAFLNEKSIKVSTQKNLDNALLATGFPFKFKKFLPQYMDCFEEIFNNISGIRRMGAASIDLAYLAAGRFDGFWELGLSPWDVAAGSLIISEAGGVITDFWGTDNYLYDSYIVASNGKIHQPFLKIIQNHFKEFVRIN